MSSTLYVWQEQEPNGEWGTIAAALPPGVTAVLPPELRGPTLLVSRSLATAQIFGLAAIAHHDATGRPVRCARFALEAIEREIP